MAQTACRDHEIDRIAFIAEQTGFKIECEGRYLDDACIQAGRHNRTDLRSSLRDQWEREGSQLIVLVVEQDRNQRLVVSHIFSFRIEEISPEICSLHANHVSIASARLTGRDVDGGGDRGM